MPSVGSAARRPSTATSSGPAARRRPSTGAFPATIQRGLRPAKSRESERATRFEQGANKPHPQAFSPTTESFGVLAQIGSGVVRGGPEVSFHGVPPEFQQGSTRFCEGCGVVRALKRAPHAVGDITRAYFFMSRAQANNTP